MEVQVNLSGRKRKELAQTISGILNVKVAYKGSPSFHYEVDGVKIDRNAILTFEDKVPTELRQSLLSKLEEYGYSCSLLGMSGTETEASESNPESTESDVAKTKAKDDVATPTTVTAPPTVNPTAILVPITDFDETAQENLRLLIASKANLIKKAIGTDALPVEKTDKALCFPWFADNLTEAERTAYEQFIEALCWMAKKQTRVLAVEKPIENEKYAFRCFLLRLGFIGEGYAESRRILLRNLSGNGSWKNSDGKTRKTTSTQGSVNPSSSKNERKKVNNHQYKDGTSPPVMPKLLLRLFRR